MHIGLFELLILCARAWNRCSPVLLRRETLQPRLSLRFAVGDWLSTCTTRLLLQRRARLFVLLSEMTYSSLVAAQDDA